MKKRRVQNICMILMIAIMTIATVVIAGMIKAKDLYKSEQMHLTDGDIDSSYNVSKAEKDADKLYCKVEIRCDSILENMENLRAEKADYVPADGMLLEMSEVEFKEGETAFDVLKGVCEDLNIQLEYAYTPVYESYYIEGINHIYEFDCGSESGWMYKVNGSFPNYGCSAYEVQEGDEIVWCYTCNRLGEDVGGSL